MERTLQPPLTHVFIVEDSAPIRERLAAILGDIEGVSVVGEADSVQAAVDGILRTRPEAVLLDIQLADGSGVEVLRRVHPHAPDMVFAVLSNTAEPAYRRTCFKAGASHFFDKSTEFGKIREMFAALRTHGQTGN